MIMDPKALTASDHEREIEEDDGSSDMEVNQNNSEKEEGELSSDDDYHSKLSELQTYIPFLQQMIQRLEESNDKSREAQLQKMKSLYSILSNTKKKLKVEALKRCEDVLKNLMEKVEKTVGLSKDVVKTKKKYRWDPVSSRRSNDSPVSDSSRSSEPSTTIIGSSKNLGSSAKMKSGSSVTNFSSTNSSERSLGGHSQSRKSGRSERPSELDNASDINKSYSSTNKSSFLDKASDYDAVVSSTTQSVDGEASKPFTEVLQTLAATNTPAHEEVKSKVSSSTSQRSLVTSTSVSSKEKQNEKNESRGLEQSREKLKKLLNQITSSPTYPPSSEVNSKSFDDDRSPTTEWPHQKEVAWDHFSVGSDSCDSELFTRRDGYIIERGRSSAPSVGYSFHEDSKDESPVRGGKSLEKLLSTSKSDQSLKSPSSLKLPSLSSPPHTKVLSSDHGEDSDKSDSGSGTKSLRAKLEQEIHKMHRVGVSTGGALRGLVSKDNKIEISPKSLKSHERKLSEEGDKQSKDILMKTDERPLDRRRPLNVDKSQSPVKNNSSNPLVVSRKKSPVKLVKPSNPVPEETKQTDRISQLSQEELKRIVTQNLRNLPSPPPIPKEILENKMSPTAKGQGSTWQPIIPPQPAQKESIPMTPASPDEQFHSPSYSQTESFFVPQQQSFGVMRQEIIHDHRAAMQGHHMGMSGSHQNVDVGTHSTQQFEGRAGVVYLKDVNLRSQYPPQNSEETRFMQASLSHGLENQGNVIHNAMDSGRPSWPGEDPRCRTPGMEGSHYPVHHRPVEVPRCRTPGLDGSHPTLPHHVDDSRMNVTNNFSDDSRPRPMEDRPPGERRRGLLPTPPRHTYQNPQVNRVHAQEVAQRYNQRMNMTENRALLSPEQQTWDWNHGQKITHETYNNRSVQGTERFQQQLFRRDVRGQMNAAAEGVSPVGRHQAFQWGTNDNRVVQKGMHGNYMSGYQAHPSRSDVGHPKGHPKGNTRQSPADPRLHKSEALLPSPDITPTADIRSFGASGMKSEAGRAFSSRQQQPTVSGISRLPSVSKRDPRRRSIEEADNSRRIGKEEEDKKKRSSDSWRSRYCVSRPDLNRRKDDKDKRRSSDAHQRSEEEMKEKAERISPLDALYGTTAVPKTGKGYGFQNFRIPKIKREPLTPRPPTPPRPAPPKEKFDDAEVSVIKQEKEESDKKVEYEKVVKQEIKEEVNKEEKSSTSKEHELQPKDITLEFIESLIHKSLESGEGRKIFEHAKFLEKLSEKLKAKSFRKIRRILESDSDSDADDESDDKSKRKKEKEDEKKKKDEKTDCSKAVVQVIEVSDDSDDEPLAVKIVSKNKDTVNEADKASEKSVESSVAVINNEKSMESVGEEATKSECMDKEGTPDAKPAKKPAAKRRNSLELLQQDIRDMFIREGVVTATGYRMCRLLKEVQGGASLDDLAKHEAKRMEAETKEDLEEKNEKTTRRNVKTKKKSSGSSKTNKKSGKGYVTECESEEEMSPISSFKRKSKRNRIDDSYDSDSSACTIRSTRSTRQFKPSAVRSLENSAKDNVKRRRIPRVILEKADVSKYHLSKTHTGSSDDSINELLDNVASVDFIPEKSEPKKRNYPKVNSSKKGATKKSTRKVSDSEVEDGLDAKDKKGDGVESGLVWCKRKRNEAKKCMLGSKIDDAIRRLYKGKVPSVSLLDLFGPATKNISKKNEAKTVQSNAEDITFVSDSESKDSAILVDRLNGKEKQEACNDDKKNDGLRPEILEASDVAYLSMKQPEEESCEKNSPIKINLIKKKTTQKKKKRTRWQFGIIKKKSGSHKVKASLYSEENKELLEKDKRDSLSHQEEEQQAEKEKGDDEKNIGNDADVAEGVTSAGIEGEKKSTESEEKDANFTDLDYAFNSEAKQTACLLCQFEGRAIVQHYKQTHPGSEVLISRLPVDEACRAITESTEKGYSKKGFKEETLAGKRKRPSSFLCRFCNYSAQYAVNFYEHTSSHTGEYRYQCCKCPYVAASRTTFKGHFYSHHPKNKLKQGLNLKVLTEGPSNSAKILFGYLCSSCNFVQLLEENLEKHISLRHSEDKDVKIIRINLSRPVENVDKAAESDGENWLDDTEIHSEDEGGDKEREFLDNENDNSLMSESSEVDTWSAEHPDAKKDSPIEKAPEMEEKAEEIVSEPKPPKKPKHLEAFISLSSDVDKEANAIMEERIKCMQNIAKDVRIGDLIADIEKKVDNDDDITVILELKIQTVKLENEADGAMENQEDDEASPQNIRAVKMDVDPAVCDTRIDEGCNEDNVKDSVEVAPLASLDVSVANDNEPLIDTWESQEGSSQTSESANEIPKTVSEDVTIVPEEKIRSLIEGKVSGLVSLEATPEKKIKGPLKRLADLNSETNKFALPMVAPEESGDRRITRSYSKPDDEFPDSSKQDSSDTVCDANSNHEIIEITDDSEESDEENDDSDDDIEDVEEEAPDNAEKTGGTSSLESHITKNVGEGIFIIKGNLIEKLRKCIVSRKKALLEQNKEIELVQIKEEPKASPEENLTDTSSIIKPLSGKCIQIGTIQAEPRINGTVLFSCLVGYCVFTTTNSQVMTRHVGRNHKSQTWNGICTECNKRVFGEDANIAPEEHKYPLNFILEHLTTVHLADSAKQNLPAASVSESDASVSEMNEISEGSDIRTSGIKQLEIGSEKTEDETKEETPAPQAPRIRMRRLSGDKLSKPAYLDDHNSSSETFPQMLNASEDSSLIPNAGESMIRIESVVSLRPDADPDTVIQETVQASPSKNTLDVSSSGEKVVSPQRVLLKVSGKLISPNSPKKMQLVPILPRPSSASSITIAPSTGSNIPQPLVNLSQIMRPGRVILPKENQLSTLGNATGMWSGVPNILSKTVLKKLPTSPLSPLVPTFISSNPNEVQSSSNIIVAPSASSSTYSSITSSPTVIHPVPSSSSSAPIQTVSADKRYPRLVLPLQNESHPTRNDTGVAVKSTHKFFSQGSARTSLFVYQRYKKTSGVVVNKTRQNLSHKISKAFEHAKAAKISHVYESMLTDEKLRHLFKCMARHCIYTTDSPKAFEKHCLKHVHVYRKMYKLDADESEEVMLEECLKDFSLATARKRSDLPDVDEQAKVQLGYWPQCAYCGTIYCGPNALSEHIQEYHGHCLYQCSYCFFRAVSYSYITMHENTSHINNSVRVLLCHKIPGILPPVSLQRPRKEVVMLYVCNQGHCGQKFCNPAAFRVHLTSAHNNLTYYYCHMCVGQYMKPDALLTHYKLHSYCYYQCQYCLHGTDTKEEMQHHLCNFHSNQKAEVIIRSSDPIMPESGPQIDVPADELNIVHVDDTPDSDGLCVPPTKPITEEPEETESDFWRSYSYLIEEYKLDPENEKLLSAVIDLACDPRVSESNQDDNPDPKTSVNTSLEMPLTDNDVIFEDYVPRSRGNSTDSDIVILDDESNKEEAVRSFAEEKDKEIAPLRESDPLAIDGDNNGDDDDYDDADSDIMIIDASPVSSPTKKRKLSDSSLEPPTPIKQPCGEKQTLPKIVSVDEVKENSSTTKNKEEDEDLGKKQVFEREEQPEVQIDTELVKDGSPNEGEIVVQTDRLRVDVGGKDVNVNADILARCRISAEELAKTGHSGEELYRCGNHTCTFAAENANQLREHLFICDLSRESTGMNCVHCQRPFKQITPYLEHLKVHGICRYSCSVCLFRAPLGPHVAKHMKQKHRVFSSQIIPVNAHDTNPETALFVVCTKEKPKPKITYYCRNKRIFSPDEIDLLPNKYIVNNALSCGACTFKSKVVGNIRRHLGFHNDPNLNPSDIPDFDPVNPVPCLEKKEMMFDKMTNLAASSHPLGRMGGKAPPTPSASFASEQLPKFVPEHERYVCGAPGCNYLTCDETMLRYHLRALHFDEVAYRCPHCPESLQKEISGQTISIDRLGAHLKMHDSRLYKCAYCLYYHFQRHIVERHVSDKHPERRPYVQVVREPDGEATSTNKLDDIPAEEESGATSASMWLCGLCKGRFGTRAEVVEHTSSIHNCKSQYKCGVCTFRSSSKPNCETHFSSRHPDIPLDLITVYQRMEGSGTETPAVTVPPVQASTPKRFDTTPLWLRNMSRVRHIRGVLLENEEETRAHLQKIEEENAPKKPKVKEPTPSSSRAASPIPDVKDPLEEKFAPYGKPVNGNMFFCTLCTKYKTRFKADMRDHLYRELNYAKFICQNCGLKACSKNQLQRHHRVHERQFKLERIEPLERDGAVEEWVENLLSKQHHEMKGVPDVVPSKSINSAIRAQDGTPVSTPPSTPASTPSKLLSSSVVKFTGKYSVMKEDAGGSDTELAEKSCALKRKLASTVARDLDDFENVPSKKTCVPALPEEEIIDVEDCVPSEPLSQSSVQSSSSTPDTKETTIVYKKAFKCRDCRASFTNSRGFKIHVRLRHLRLGSYACGYCERLASSEISMRHHLKTHHPKLPEKIIHNKEASNVKLDDEFWEKEYGITPRSSEIKAPKESPGALSNSGSAGASPAISSKTSEGEGSFPSADLDDIVIVDEFGKCRHCDYRCKSSTDLRNHEMRHWVKKPFRCGYCTFESIREYEVKKHCYKTHPTMKVRVVLQGLPAQPDIKPLQRSRRPVQSGSSSTGNSEAVQKDVESANVSANAGESVESPAFALGSAEMSEGSGGMNKIYRCFYCPQRASTLGIIHSHWQKVHKMRVMTASGASRSLPFRYKEMNMADILKDTTRKKKPSIFVCTYCNARGSLANMNLHHKEKHPDMPMKIEGQGTMTQYECAECPEFVALSVPTLKRHFEAEHPGADFRYMVRSIIQPSEVANEASVEASESVLPQNVSSGVTEGDSHQSTSSPVPSISKASSTKQGVSQYICGWCAESCPTEEKITFHQIMYHSHLEQNFTVEKSAESTIEIPPKIKVTFFVCPKCPHKTTSFDRMCNHVRKHCRPFKCGYCNRLFELPINVRQHSSQCHPLQTPKIVSLNDTESEVEALKKHISASEEEIDPLEYEQTAEEREKKGEDEQEVPRKKMRFGFARKSTSMKQRFFPTARKSTNPVPFKFHPKVQEPIVLSSESSCESPFEEEEPEYSFYGKKPEHVDLSKITTFVSVACTEVQVKASSLTHLFRLKPVVSVEDIMKRRKD